MVMMQIRFMRMIMRYLLVCMEMTVFIGRRDRWSIGIMDMIMVKISVRMTMIMHQRRVIMLM